MMYSPLGDGHHLTGLLPTILSLVLIRFSPLGDGHLKFFYEFLSTFVLIRYSPAGDSLRDL